MRENETWLPLSAEASAKDTHNRMSAHTSNIEHEHLSAYAAGVATAAKPAHQVRNCVVLMVCRFQLELSASVIVLPPPPVTTTICPPAYRSGGQLTMTGVPRLAAASTCASCHCSLQTVWNPNRCMVAAIPSSRIKPSSGVI